MTREADGFRCTAVSESCSGPKSRLETKLRCFSRIRSVGLFWSFVLKLGPLATDLTRTLESEGAGRDSHLRGSINGCAWMFPIIVSCQNMHCRSYFQSRYCTHVLKIRDTVHSVLGCLEPWNAGCWIRRIRTVGSGPKKSPLRWLSCCNIFPWRNCAAFHCCGWAQPIMGWDLKLHMNNELPIWSCFG